MVRAIQLAVGCVAVLVATAGQVQAAFLFGPYAGPSAINVDTNPATSVFLNIADTGIISDLNLSVSISAPYADDVDIFLIHDSVSVHVYDAIGDTQGSFIAATFDDEAVADYPNNGAFRGTFKPRPGFLSAFDGQQLNGVWELRLLDTIFPNDGSDLISWSISGELSSAPGPAVPEPSSLAIFGIGASVMGLVSIRRCRREPKHAATA